MSEELIARMEARRIDALRRYEMLDTPPDGTLDAITSLAALLLKAPIALTTLVDSDRIWFKSRVGMELVQIGRTPGLCSSVILSDGPYVVGDAATDLRTLANPLVTGGFGLRFYAAAPLRTHDGYTLGTLCVLDREPREVDARDMGILESLAGLVMGHIEICFASRQVEVRNEDLAVRVAELEARHEEKVRLAATAAHDMRNALGSALLMAKLLLEEKFEQLNPRQRQMIESICESSEEMLRLVKERLESQEQAI